MANGLFDDKKKAELEAGINKMIAAGNSDEEIQQYIDQEKVKQDPAQAQQGAPAQDGIQDTDSKSAPGSSVSPEEDKAYTEAGYEPEVPVSQDPEIGGWENFKNNVENVYTRILGFDDRLALAAADTFETLLGKENAAKMYKAMPTYDQETGKWLDSPEEVRKAAYRELAQTDAQQKQTVGLIDSWDKLTKEEGDTAKDVGNLVSAAAGSGLNMLSTLVTSGLTFGAGLYTDMMGDAIVDANKAKAEKLGISIEELYETGQNEFAVPAAVGVAGGLLEGIGVKAVGDYVGKVASKNVGGAILAMANNSGKEGLTEWLQFGLENYNNERAAGNKDAAGTALEKLFTREGAETALQGAVGALVGGEAGKLASKAKVAAAKATGLIESDKPAENLAQAQDSKEYGFNTKDGDKKYNSKVKESEKVNEAAQEGEQEQTQEYDKEKADAAREKRTQDRNTRQLVQELSDEYDGTVEAPNQTDKTAYILKGLEDNAGIKTVDEAAGLSKSRQRDVMNLVTKASIGLRSPADTKRLDDMSINIHKAAQALEATTDLADQEALHAYINDQKAEQANIITNTNRKVLLASPKAVASAIEAASELENITNQETAIQGNTNLEPAIREDMLRNLQDKKNAAIEKGDTARQEIEKSSEANSELVDDNSKYLQQLLDEEVAEYDQKTDALIEEASDLGLVADPDGAKVTNEGAAEGRNAISKTDGVTEFGKTFGGNFGTRLEGLQAKTKIEMAAKKKGMKADVQVIDVNPQQPGGETQVVAEIYSPRQEGLVDSINKLKAPQEQEGEIEGDQTQEQEQEGPTKEEHLDRIAEKHGANFENVGEGVYHTDNRRSAYNLVGQMKKEGYPDAKVIEGPDGKYAAVAGEQQGEGIAFNLVEDADKESGPENFRRHQDLSKVAGSRVKMNIGLENNPKNYDAIVAELAKNPKVRLGTTEQVTGEYNGNPERTLVVDAKYDGTAKEFRTYIEGLNKTLTQEAIGATFNGRGSLIYDKDFQGEKYKFDKQYFLSPSNNQNLTEDIEAARRTQPDLTSPGGKKPSQIAPPNLGQTQAEKARAQAAIQEGPDSQLDDNIVLGKDVKDARKATDEAFESSPVFDRDLADSVRKSPIEDIKAQPQLDDQMIADYNADLVSDKDFAKSLAKYIIGKESNPDLRDFAIEKMLTQLAKGNFKNKTPRQVLGKAKAIAQSAASLRRQAEGQSKDQITEQNRIRRANDAFYAEHGREPGFNELAEYVNEKHGTKVTPRNVQEAIHGELPSGEGLSQEQGTVKERSQEQTTKAAGLDRLSDAILGGDLSAKIDSAVAPLLEGSPVIASEGKFADQSPRRGAGFDTKGDLAATKVKKSATEIDKDVRRAISDALPADAIRDNFAEIKDLLGLTQESFDDMSRAEKQALKRQVVRGLAQEAEQRLGKNDKQLSVKEFKPLAKANKEYIDNVTAKLQEAWPGIKLATSQEAISKAVQGLNVAPSQIKGAYMSGENTVLINPKQATYDTPIHEFSHIWADKLQVENPALFKKGIELLKGSEFMRTVDGIPTYNQMRKNGELNKFYKEVMANAIGKHGAELFNNKSKANTWDKWMNKMGSWLKSKLGIQSNKDFDNLQLKDWLDIGTEGTFSGKVTQLGNTLENSVNVASKNIPGFNKFPAKNDNLAVQAAQHEIAKLESKGNLTKAEQARLKSLKAVGRVMLGTEDELSIFGRIIPAVGLVEGIGKGLYRWGKRQAGKTSAPKVQLHEYGTPQLIAKMESSELYKEMEAAHDARVAKHRAEVQKGIEAYKDPKVKAKWQRVLKRFDEMRSEGKWPSPAGLVNSNLPNLSPWMKDSMARMLERKYKQEGLKTEGAFEVLDANEFSRELNKMEDELWSTQQELMKEYEFYKQFKELGFENINKEHREGLTQGWNKVVNDLIFLRDNAGKVLPSEGIVSEYVKGQYKASKQYTDLMVERLRAANPSIPVFTDAQSFADRGADFEKTRGFYEADIFEGGAGGIFLNPSLSGKDTPVHEFGHMWAATARVQRPELYKRGLELLQGSSLMDTIYRSKGYIEAAKSAASPHDFLMDEVMAEAIGRKGAEIFDKTKDITAWDKFRNKIGNYLKKVLGLETNKPFDQITLEDFLNTAATEILTGKTLIGKEGVSPIINNPEYTQSSRSARFIDRKGNIRKTAQEAAADARAKEAKLKEEQRKAAEKRAAEIAQRQAELASRAPATVTNIGKMLDHYNKNWAANPRKYGLKGKPLVTKIGDTVKMAFPVDDGAQGKKFVDFLREQANENFKGAEVTSRWEGGGIFGQSHQVLEIKTGGNTNFNKVNAAVPSIPKNLAKNPGSAIQFSVKEPANQAKILKEIAKQQAEKAAKKTTKKKSIASRIADAFSGVANDDFEGLIDRLQGKFPKNPQVKALRDLHDKYRDGYHKLEKAATKARADFKTAGDKLATALGVKKAGLDNYLAGDSTVEVGGQPISINQAMAIYSDKGNKEIPAKLKKEVEAALTPEMKEFVDNLPYKMEAGETIQQGNLDYINKTLEKEALSEFLKDKDSKFGPEAVQALGAEMGQGYAEALQDSLDRMSGKKGRGAEATTAKWQDWLQGSVGVTMFLNIKSAALQGLSIWNYMSPSNLLGFNKDLATVMKPGSKTNKLFHELWNDPMMKERRARAGFDVNAAEITEAMNQGTFGKGVAKLLNKGFMLTSGMDSVAIAAGGAAFINQGLTSGKFKSKEAALKAWREQTAKSQQSARPDKVSKNQKAPVSKLILAFANTPQQYFRLSQKAFRVFKSPNSKPADKIKAAKDIAYYMAIQNGIFTMAQAASTALLTGWGGDEEEKKEAENSLNSMADTWLRGMGLAGAVTSALKNSAINAYRENKKGHRGDVGKGILKGAASVSPPLGRKINDLLAIGSAYKYDKGYKGARSAHAVAGSRAIAAGANLPADWLQKKLAAIQLLATQEADMIEFLQMFAGYSEYSVLGDKKGEGFDFDDIVLNDINFDDIDFEDVDFNV